MKKDSKKVDRLVQVVSKLGNQRELSAIRDAFSLLLPLIIAGAIGILGVTFFFGGWGATSTSILGWIAKASGGIKDAGSGDWKFLAPWDEISKNGTKVFSVLNSATFGWFTIYIVFLLGYVYSKSLKTETPILGASVALASYLIAGGTDSYFLGANGLLIGIIIALLATYIYNFLQKSSKLKLKMPNGVPPAVGRAFSALFPIILTALFFGLLNYAFWAAGNYGNISIYNKNDEVQVAHSNMSLVSMFFKGVSSTFISFIGSKNAGLGVLIVYLLFVGFFWWCGVHGSNLLSGIFYPIWFTLITQNIDAIKDLGSYQAAFDAGRLSIANWGFIEQFSMVTGWGITGMLVLAAFIFSKNPLWRQVNKIAAPSGVFNINEPVTYGYPLMLNPILAVPTILAGPIAGTIAYVATDLELIRVAYIYVPWPMPTPIGALLTTGMDWRVIPVILTILGVVFFLYLPFVFLDNRIQKNTKVELSPSLIERIKLKRSK